MSTYRPTRFSNDDPRTAEDFRRPDGTIDIHAMVDLSASRGDGSGNDVPAWPIEIVHGILSAYEDKHGPVTAVVAADLVLAALTDIGGTVWGLMDIAAKSESELTELATLQRGAQSLPPELAEALDLN